MVNKEIKMYVKDDGMSCPNIYGGNKPRKLEFVLADALQKGSKSLLLLGSAGSMSVLASIIHC
jgi:1-aminocyclopropane-1-carboxylate deaminase/D-cysteine desulfhydrase-like pyridoxal-dependent ACC family enzyme